tara:strand:+ start:16841 stop:17521 length:681 start_codon:yes stop_codon:yes gene_type:complete
MKISFRCLPGLQAILPRPVPAGRTLPDWLRSMAMTEDLGAFGEDRTVKQCPPFIDAMTAGFVIPLPCDIEIDKGRFTWNWPHDESPLAFHFASQVAGTPFDIDNVSVLKFINFWTMRTEPGVSVLFTHPFNRPDLPFQTLTGLVDTDGFTDLPVHFPAQWTDPTFAGILEKGTPVAHCIPIRRESLDLEISEMTASEARESSALKAKISATPGFYKDNFRRAATEE